MFLRDRREPADQMHWRRMGGSVWKLRILPDIPWILPRKILWSVSRGEIRRGPETGTVWDWQS